MGMPAICFMLRVTNCAILAMAQRQDLFVGYHARIIRVFA
jgi:hypothetical protein